MSYQQIFHNYACVFDIISDFQSAMAIAQKGQKRNEEKLDALVSCLEAKI